RVRAGRGGAGPAPTRRGRLRRAGEPAVAGPDRVAERGRRGRRAAVRDIAAARSRLTGIHNCGKFAPTLSLNLRLSCAQVQGGAAPGEACAMELLEREVRFGEGANRGTILTPVSSSG